MIIELNALLRKFSWIAWTLNAATIVALLVLAVDRDPPFSVISVEPAAARAGEVVIIRARVHRDKERDCSAVFSRYVFDAKGTRFDNLAQPARASDKFIDEMERLDPGRLTVAFVVPAEVRAGPARLETVLNYRCNVVHALLPIEVTTQMAFTVLP